MSMGLLLARSFRPVRVRGIFWFSAAVLFALFSVPFLTDGAVHWNGVFEMACIMVVFPLMVWLAAWVGPPTKFPQPYAALWATSPIRSIWCTILSCTCSTAG